MPAKIANAPGADHDRADGQAREHDAGDERRRDVPAGPPAFGFGADLDRGRFLPARPAEALGPDPNRARGLGLVRRALLAEELGDRDLLGGLWRRRLRIDPHLVPDGLGEVVGRGLDSLDVRRVLHCLWRGLGHDLWDRHRLGLLDQLGHAGLVAGKVDVPSRAGLGSLADVVPLRLRLGLEQERALDVGLGRRLLARERLVADGRLPRLGLGGRLLLVLGFGGTVLRPGLERHGRATRVGFTLRLLGLRAGRLVVALRARPLFRTLALGRLRPVDVLDRREELVEILEEVLALVPFLVLRHAQISLSSASLCATTSSMSEMCLSVSF